MSYVMYALGLRVEKHFVIPMQTHRLDPDTTLRKWSDYCGTIHVF